MKTRADLLRSKGYWIAKLQIDLFRELEIFKKKTGMNNTQLANYLGCTKGYVSQLLNGNFDHKMSKLVDLSLAIGKAPKIEFEDLNQYIKINNTYESHSTTGATFTFCKESVSNQKNSQSNPLAA